MHLDVTHHMHLHALLKSTLKYLLDCVTPGVTCLHCLTEVVVFDICDAA
jgi:hypothetical protein